MLYQVILNIYMIALVVIGIFSLEAVYLAYKYWQGRKREKCQHSDDFIQKLQKGTPEEKLAFIEKKFGELVKNKSVTRLIKKMGERISWLPRNEFTAAMKKTEAAAKEAAKVLNK